MFTHFFDVSQSAFPAKGFTTSFTMDYCVDLTTQLHKVVRVLGIEPRPYPSKGDMRTITPYPDLFTPYFFSLLKDELANGTTEGRVVLSEGLFLFQRVTLFAVDRSTTF